MAYSAITADVLSVIKAPPLLAPTAVLDFDTATSQNNINGRFFQFKIRFIYDDNEDFMENRRFRANGNLRSGYC